MVESINIDNVKSIEFVPFMRTYRFKTAKFYPCLRFNKKFPFIQFLRKKDCRPDEISFGVWDDWGDYSSEELKKLNYSIIDYEVYINPHVLIKYMDGSEDRIYFENENDAKEKCKELVKKHKHKMIAIK